jgi:hypothetical protein
MKIPIIKIIMLGFTVYNIIQYNCTDCHCKQYCVDYYLSDKSKCICTAVVSHKMTSIMSSYPQLLTHGQCKYIFKLIISKGTN